MRVLLRYFREHPWQRRAVTLSLTAILGAAAAWVALPIIQDRRILALLGSDSPARQHQGIVRAEHAVKKRPQLIELLEENLDASDDSRFSAIMEVLIRAGRYDDARRTPGQKDRCAAINFRAAPEADQRLTWLAHATLSGRDNPHVRRVLADALSDASAEVRSEAAVLAARLGDDQALLSLLGDEDPSVRARAATSAGLARRAGCADAVAAGLAADRTDTERAAAAFALIRLDATRFGPSVLSAAEQALRTGRGDLLEKLLAVATGLPGPAAGEFVGKVIRQGVEEGELPPATALVAARKLNLKGSLPAAEAAVDRLISVKADLTVGQAMVLAAAVHAADRLGAGPELFKRTIKELWHPGPGVSLAMVYAAEALGRRPEAGKDAEALALLAAGARDERAPLAAASGAAAVALFELSPESEESASALRTVCESEAYLAGDYVVWHLGRSDRRRQAAGVAAGFFAPHVYDKAVRSVGAMLLAMVYRGTDRASDAERIIQARLDGGLYGPESDPFVAGAYQCALMFLGRADFDRDVAELSYTDTFPKRRALTALMLRRNAAGFDRVLAGKRQGPEAIDSFLSGRLMARVYRALAPELTAVDVDAPASVRYWQCGLLRDDYLIHRSSILAGPPATQPAK